MTTKPKLTRRLTKIPYKTPNISSFSKTSLSDNSPKSKLELSLDSNSSQNTGQPSVNSSVHKTCAPAIENIPNNELEYLKQLTNSLLFPANKQDTASQSDDLLPPLTSSNDLDIRLYAFFSLLLNNFVFGWYSGSLNLDSRTEFTKELIFLLAHVSRNIQERIQHCNDDVIQMLITDIPYLVEKHFESVTDVLCEVAKNCNDDKQLDSVQFKEIWLKRYADGLDDDQVMMAYRRIFVKTLVLLLFPHETVASNVSKEFLVSLLDDIIMKNIIESFCDCFTIWNILGKISSKLTIENKYIDDKRSLKATKTSKLGRFLKFVSITKEYQIKNNDGIKYQDLIPLIKLINFVTLVDSRIPLIFTIIQITLQLFLKIPIMNRFINNCIKMLIFQNLLTLKTSETLVDFLRNMMFPLDMNFDMKPRYIPQTEEELNVIYNENFIKIKKLLKSNKTMNALFVSPEDTDGNVDKKIEFAMNMFRHREVNKILIQRLIDLVASRLFPELTTMDVIE